jgi:hypothetical protein
MAVYKPSGPLRHPQVRGWAYATAGAHCPSVCGSVLVVLPSSFCICSALVCPRPPQAPMIKSSSLTRACPPIPGSRGSVGGWYDHYQVPEGLSLSTPPYPTPKPFPRLRKAGRNSRRGAVSRPSIWVKLRNADTSAD